MQQTDYTQGAPRISKSRRRASSDVVVGRLFAIGEAFRSSRLPRVFGVDVASPSGAHDLDYRARIAELLHPSEALPGVIDGYEKLWSDMTLHGLKMSTDFKCGDDCLLSVDEVNRWAAAGQRMWVELGHEIPLAKNVHSD